MWHLFFMGVYRENHKCEARALRSRAIFEDKVDSLDSHTKTSKTYLKHIKERGTPMNRFEYIVESIDGDYANLRRTDIESDELKLVARALLPPEIMEGTKLLYEWMQYSTME